MIIIRRALAISPHLDDAALSVGAQLAELALHGVEVQVYTLFAGEPSESLSDVAKAFHDSCRLPCDGTAIGIRRQEDQAAMAALRAHAHHAGFLEVIYRRGPDGHWLCKHDRGMFDSGAYRETDLYRQLVMTVLDLCERLKPDLVLTCAAIGGHVDHLITKQVVTKVADTLQIRTVIWEDLPYAANERENCASGSMILLQASPESWSRKWQAIACYTTQVRMLWPKNMNWVGFLYRHATYRGQGRPVELLWEMPHGALSEATSSMT